MSTNQDFVKEAVALIEEWASAVTAQLGQKGLVVHAFDIKSALYELCEKHRREAASK